MIAPSSPADSSAIKGHVIRVTGTIVDVQFPQESAPSSWADRTADGSHRHPYACRNTSRKDHLESGQWTFSFSFELTMTQLRCIVKPRNQLAK